MQGDNTIEMNKATMIEALQFYLNSKLTEAATVTNVDTVGGKSPYEGVLFRVTISSPQLTPSGN